MRWQPTNHRGKIMKRLLVSTACLLFFVEVAHAETLKHIQEGLDREHQAQQQQILLQQQQANPLICRFIIREGAGWCRTNPTGLPSYARGGACNCGGFKLGEPFNETVMGPVDGTLANGPAPTNASGAFEFFAKYGCGDPIKAPRGQC